jgi:hypothetical protein
MELKEIHFFNIYYSSEHYVFGKSLEFENDIEF